MTNNCKKIPYSLLEIIEKITGEPLGTLDNLPTFYDLFKIKYITPGESAQTYWSVGNGRDLFDGIILNHYLDIILFSDKPIETSQEAINKCRDFVYNFYKIHNETQLKYGALLNSYSLSRNKLLDKLKRETRSANRFNDTPQNYDIEDLYSSDGHATNTNANHGVEEYDSGTAMARLKEIQDNYKNIIQAWVNEFSDLFISSLNYEVGYDY